MKNIKQSFWKDTIKTKLIIYLSKTVKTRLCSKENFREHFGLSSILVKAPRLQSWPPEKKFRGALGASKHSSWGAQASQVGRLSTSDEEVFSTHANLTRLLITKLGNFSFWVRQKPACCLMKPIKVFVPFRFTTRNVSIMPPNCLGFKERKVKKSAGLRKLH